MTATIAWKSHTKDPKVASFRLRGLLPCEHLIKAGLNCELFKPEKKANYSVVIFQKAFSDSDYQLAQELKKNGCITVLDMCDNHFYDPDNDPAFAERSEKLIRMIDLVDHVTTSTKTLTEYINKKSVYTIDDYIDPPENNWLNKIYTNYALNREFKKHKLDNTFKIVWYGNAGVESQQFGMMDIELVMPDLIKLNEKLPLSLTVISNNTDKFHQYVGKNQPFPTLYISWKKHYFSYQLPRFDACIIPANINPFTRVKTNNRVLLSLQSGVPVVASPIPSYLEFSSYIGIENWHDNLRAIALNPTKAKNNVNLGQQFIQQHYDASIITQQWLDFIETIQHQKVSMPLNTQKALAV